MTETVPLNRLDAEEYAQVICYPKFDMEELRRRLDEMRQLGVKSLCFDGDKRVGNKSVLGKGCVGVVVQACTEAGKIALKIRRADADRAGMKQEAMMLQTANSVGVGPKLEGFTGNLLAMEFIDGILFPKWIETLKREEDAAKERVRRALRDILEQCWRLDEIGLDHGELSRAPKHILLGRGDRAWVLDFESASNIRKPSNVTSVCQFLLMTGKTAESVNEIIGHVGREEFLAALRTYKKSRIRESFETILRVCDL